jgi:hypothetical protein
LARLAAKYGPEIGLRDLTERFSYDSCGAETRSNKGKSACDVYLPDLDNPQRLTCRQEWCNCGSLRAADLC